ncbi:MAG: hydroxyisourate hydrolase [Betaproteobacteria bacterium]|nr:hydroxyisourate hydrolase [Betaproteobacteria bacterium]
MGRLTTHVLDTAQGRPAAGMTIEFSVRAGGGWRLIRTVQTNGDGRTDEPLLAHDAMRAGEYQLVFHAGDYFRRAGVALPQPAFLDRVPLQFGIADAGADYHVPLLCSPWSYSTYRGS